MTLKRGQHYKYLPYAFTENGVAMLSSVLNSERAIMVNIQIMRTFTRLREILNSHEELKQKLAQMERKYDDNFKVVFDAIRALMAPPEKPRKKIGFGLREKQMGYRRKRRKNGLTGLTGWPGFLGPFRKKGQKINPPGNFFNEVCPYLTKPDDIWLSCRLGYHPTANLPLPAAGEGWGEGESSPLFSLLDSISLPRQAVNREDPGWRVREGRGGM